MPSKESIDQMINEMLSIRNTKEYDLFMNRDESTSYVINKAYEFMVSLPLSDLPKYINHPSANIKDIVKKRLRGRDDFLFMSYYK